MSLAAAHLWHKPSERAAWMRRFVIVSDSAVRIYGTRSDHEQRHDPIFYIELLTSTSLLNGSDNIICQGWLVKKGKIKWNPRWCALVKYGYLNYIDPEQKQGIRCIDISQSQFVLDSSHNTIQWKSDRGEWFQFRCDSPSIQTKWHKSMLNVQRHCMLIRRENELKNTLNKEPTLFAFTVRKLRSINNTHDKDIRSNRFEQHYFCADSEQYLEGWKKCITEQIAHCEKINDAPPQHRRRQQSIYLRTKLYTNNAGTPDEDDHEDDLYEDERTHSISTRTVSMYSVVSKLYQKGKEDDEDYEECSDIQIDERMEQLMNALNIPKHARKNMLSLNKKQKIKMLQQHRIKQQRKQKESGMRWSEKFASYHHKSHHISISTLQQFSVVLRAETDQFAADFIENLGLNHLCRLATKYRSGHSANYSQFDMELVRVFKAILDCSLYALSAMVSHETTIRIIVDLIDSADIKISELAVSLLVTMVGFQDDAVSIAASNKILTSLKDSALTKGQRNKYKVLLDHMSVKDVLNGSMNYDVYTLTLINYLIMTKDEIHLRMEERRLLNSLNFDKILSKLHDRTKCKHTRFNDALINQIETYRKLYDTDKRNVDHIVDGWDIIDHDFDIDNPCDVFQRVHDQCLHDGFINELTSILKNLMSLPSNADHVWYNVSKIINTACKPIQNEIVYGRTEANKKHAKETMVHTHSVVGGVINANNFDENYVSKGRNTSTYPSYRELKTMLEIREAKYNASSCNGARDQMHKAKQKELDAARDKQLQLEDALLAEKNKSYAFETQLNHLLKYGTTSATLQNPLTQESSNSSNDTSSSSFVMVGNDRDAPPKDKPKAKKEIKLVIMGGGQDKFNKYRKMIKFKMPKTSIVNRMRQDGVDLSIIDAYKENDTLPGGMSVATAAVQVDKGRKDPKAALMSMLHKNKTQNNSAKKDDDAKLNKYKRMIKMNIPKQSVINRMRQDQVSSSLIAMLFPNAVEAKNAKPTSTIMNGIQKKKAKPKPKLPPDLKPKSVIKPRNKMRNLHWTTVNPFDVKKTIWKHIDEQDLKLDIESLESKFCWKRIETKAKAQTNEEKNKKKRVKPEIVRVLDTRRAYNIEIFLGRLRMNPWNLREAMLALNEDRLSLDTIHKLINFVPTAEESQCLNGYEKEKNLGVAENFVKIVRTVDDNLIERLVLWEFKMEFDDLYNSEIQKLHWLRTAHDLVHNSDDLRLMFCVILSIGNYMNGSTAKGQAYGFKLNSLSQLIRSRMVDNSGTLLQFIYEFLDADETHYKNALNFTKDLQCLEDATTVDIPILRQNIAAIGSKLKLIQKRINKYNKSSEIHRMGDNFLPVFTPFYNESINKFNVLQSKRDTVFKLLKDLAMWLNEPNDRNFKFLKTLNEFRLNFLNACKISKQQKEKLAQIEKRKQRQQKQKQKQKPMERKKNQPHGNEQNISDVVIQTLASNTSGDFIQRLQDRNRKCIKT
eukprot:117082_1